VILKHARVNRAVIPFDYAFLTLRLRPRAFTPRRHHTNAFRSPNQGLIEVWKTGHIPATKIHLS
jgi:hypothetical protein